MFCTFLDNSCLSCWAQKLKTVLKQSNFQQLKLCFVEHANTKKLFYVWCFFI